MSIVQNGTEKFVRSLPSSSVLADIKAQNAISHTFDAQLKHSNRNVQYKVQLCSVEDLLLKEYHLQFGILT